jgi:type II secretory pathway pseudopilin PulG
MGTWSPLSTQLNTVIEFQNLNHTITYSETVGFVTTDYPVTITAVDSYATEIRDKDNNITAGTGSRTIPTLKILNNTITGYYSEAFDNQIQYRDNDDIIFTVNRFSDINKTNLSELIYCLADTTNRKTFSYIATASNGATQTYTINVDNNWNTERDELLRYIAQAKLSSHPKVYTPPVPQNEAEYQKYGKEQKFTGISVEWININGDVRPMNTAKNSQAFWTITK